MNRRQRRHSMIRNLSGPAEVSVTIGRLTLEGVSRAGGRRLAESLEQGLAASLRDATALPQRAAPRPRAPETLNSSPGEAPEVTGGKLAGLVGGRLLP
jgi:hypothetical protein